MSHPGAIRPPDLRQRPEWLKVRLPSGAVYERTRQTVKFWNLHTVCESALCPNLGECWGHGTVTIMVLGDVCTRGCRFCAVKTGNPRGIVDHDEPRRVGEAVAALGLKYVVLTSVDRDDLADGGASHFAACVREIKARTPGIIVEVLIPDFRGDINALRAIAASGPEVIGQNIETVRRLTPRVRDHRAGYDLTLQVLAYFKSLNPEQLTKSGIMVGLGETREEIVETLKDLRSAGTDFVTIGQYLQPTQRHLPVERFVTMEEFREYERIARELGFKMVASAPFVRSSFRADMLAPFARRTEGGVEKLDGPGENVTADNTHHSVGEIAVLPGTTLMSGEGKLCRK